MGILNLRLFPAVCSCLCLHMHICACADQTLPSILDQNCPVWASVCHLLLFNYRGYRKSCWCQKPAENRIWQQRKQARGLQMPAESCFLSACLGSEEALVRGVEQGKDRGGGIQSRRGGQSSMRTREEGTGRIVCSA